MPAPPGAHKPAAWQIICIVANHNYMLKPALFDISQEFKFVESLARVTGNEADDRSIFAGKSKVAHVAPRERNSGRVTTFPAGSSTTFNADSAARPLMLEASTTSRSAHTAAISAAVSFPALETGGKHPGKGQEALQPSAHHGQGRGHPVRGSKKMQSSPGCDRWFAGRARSPALHSHAPAFRPRCRLSRCAQPPGTCV